LTASFARYSEHSILLSDMAAGRIACRRIGGPLLFGRLWERLGIADVLNAALHERRFEFAVERAVFVATLHRLFVSGSDRDCAAWMQDYLIPGAEGLALHHFYRTMAWLGEEIEPPSAEGIQPRCVKDEIEEKLFERRLDLFTDLSLVFLDTTSLSFYGEGGLRLGQHGHSKDYRPDLKQMILGVVIDSAGRPICTEMVPGNTADVCSRSSIACERALAWAGSASWRIAASSAPRPLRRSRRADWTISWAPGSEPTSSCAGSSLMTRSPSSRF